MRRHPSKSEAERLALHNHWPNSRQQDSRPEVANDIDKIVALQFWP